MIKKGGRREGAGRPALPPGEKKQKICIALPAWLIRWMDSQPVSRAVQIEQRFADVATRDD